MILQLPRDANIDDATPVKAASIISLAERRLRLRYGARHISPP